MPITPSLRCTSTTTHYYLQWLLLQGLGGAVAGYALTSIYRMVISNNKGASYNVLRGRYTASASDGRRGQHQTQRTAAQPSSSPSYYFGGVTISDVVAAAGTLPTATRLLFVDSLSVIVKAVLTNGLTMWTSHVVGTVLDRVVARCGVAVTKSGNTLTRTTIPTAVLAEKALDVYFYTQLSGWAIDPLGGFGPWVAGRVWGGNTKTSNTTPACLRLTPAIDSVTPNAVVLAIASVTITNTFLKVITYNIVPTALKVLPLPTAARNALLSPFTIGKAGRRKSPTTAVIDATSTPEEINEALMAEVDATQRPNIAMSSPAKFPWFREGVSLLAKLAAITLVGKGINKVIASTKVCTVTAANGRIVGGIPTAAVAACIHLAVALPLADLCTRALLLRRKRSRHGHRGNTPSNEVVTINTTDSTEFLSVVGVPASALNAQQLASVKQFVFSMAVGASPAHPSSSTTTGSSVIGPAMRVTLTQFYGLLRLVAMCDSASQTPSSSSATASVVAEGNDGTVELPLFEPATENHDDDHTTAATPSGCPYGVNPAALRLLDAMASYYSCDGGSAATPKPYHCPADGCGEDYGLFLQQLVVAASASPAAAEAIDVLRKVEVAQEALFVRTLGGTMRLGTSAKLTFVTAVAKAMRMPSVL